MVEAVAVICLISALASGSVVILGGTLSKARNSASLIEVVGIHHKAQRESRNQVIAVHYDLNRQKLEFRVNDSVKQAVELPSSIEIRKLAVGGAIFESKEQTIEYRHGGCETYAILVGSRTGKNKWHIFSGPTSNVEVIDDEESTEASLAQWQARWANAH